MSEAGSAILEANLRALARGNPALVARLRSATARADVRFVATSSGAWSATIDEPAPTGDLRPRWLASRRDPWDEARALSAGIQVAEHPIIVVCGFGLGYHAAELCTRMKQSGLVVVFEPDVGLLRAVLERVDHSGWMSAGNLAIVTESGSDTAISDALRGLDAMMAMGVKVVDHPASLPRLGPGRGEFVDRFTRVLRAARMNVVTTLVQTEATLRNLTQNLDHYALGAGIEPLRGALAGRPALLVAAGPSLARALPLLEDASVRDRFVVIAVQTALKTLLARGIRPHFVTALDFHEISRRFYEGLDARTVEGVTLVVEPKVNPAVTSAWPGPPGSIRCTADPFLDELLGPLARPMGAITPGATVAHLNYYLARHLGCDPVILIGQDLGFTDGQYYADGAAIHDVWAAELSPVRTLEMLEWERIVRMRAQLTRQTDVLGRGIYTDEQMHTYLVGFQRAFVADAQRGLTTLDATGGGVRKQHAEPVDLREVLATRGREGTHEALLRALALDAGADRTPRRADAVGRRLAALRHDAAFIARRSRETASMLREMLDHHDDQPHVNRLIAKVERVAREVTERQPAFGLVDRLNQTGAFNRTRADRKIYIESNLDPMGVQRAQIQRDLANVTWMADAADVLGGMLDDARTALGGGTKRTRDPLGAHGSDRPAAEAAAGAPRARVWAVIRTRDGFTGLGLPRRVDRWMGRDPLAATVSRLLQAKGLEGVAVMGDEDVLRQRLGPLAGSPRIRVLKAGAWRGAPDHALRAARALCPHSWRGGLAGWTVYDEALDAPATAEACAELGAEGALVVGEDWTLVDPALCDELVARFREAPASHRLTFSQAGPGLAGVILAATLAQDLARSRERADAWASIGGLLGYLPTLPIPDPVVKPACVGVPPEVRDALVRAIPDTPARARWLESALLGAGLDADTASAVPIAAAINDLASRSRPDAPSTVTWTLRHDEPAPSSIADAALIIDARGVGTKALTRAIRHAAVAGAGAVHVRVDLDVDPADAPGMLEALLDPAVDAVSVDQHADDAVTYARVTGRGPEHFERSREHFAALWARRSGLTPEGHPTGFASARPWLVPRLTRRDEVYEQIEGWYDRALVLCRAAIIDPPAPESLTDGARIRPLTAPSLVRRRESLDHAGGRVPDRPLTEAPR